MSLTSSYSESLSLCVTPYLVTLCCIRAETPHHLIQMPTSQGGTSRPGSKRTPSQTVAFGRAQWQQSGAPSPTVDNPS